MSERFAGYRPYLLPDGRIVQIAADVADGDLFLPFELARRGRERRGRMVLALRYDACPFCGARSLSQLLPPISGRRQP